jgi:hypothetical protein
VLGRAYASRLVLRSGRNSGDTLVVRAVPPGGGRDRKGGRGAENAVPSTGPLCRRRWSRHESLQIGLCLRKSLMRVFHIVLLPLRATSCWYLLS